MRKTVYFETKEQKVINKKKHYWNVCHYFCFIFLPLRYTLKILLAFCNILKINQNHIIWEVQNFPFAVPLRNKENNCILEKLALRKLIPGIVDKLSMLAWLIDDLLPTRCQGRRKKKSHHIKRRQVTEKVWKEAMVIIIYIGPRDIIRTQWRPCKKGFNSLLAVHVSRDQMPTLRNETGATLREKQRMADQHLSTVQKHHRWTQIAPRVTEPYTANLVLIINIHATAQNIKTTHLK